MYLLNLFSSNWKSSGSYISVNQYLISITNLLLMEMHYCRLYSIQDNFCRLLHTVVHSMCL